jgi:branched-chain amino acid transport system substrate-binding protein
VAKRNQCSSGEKKMRSLFSYVFLFLLLTSCQTTQVVEKKDISQPSSPQTQKTYQEALQFFDHSQDEQAIALLKQILKKDPQSDLSDDALLLLGRIDFRKKQYTSAYRYFEQVFTSTALSPRENEARIFAVQCLLAQDQLDAAEKLIRSSLARSSLESKEKAYLFEAQLPLLLKREAQLETFEALAYLAQYHPNNNSREKYKELAKDFVDSRLSSSELKELAEESDLGDFRIEAMFKYALNLVAENKIDTAKSYFLRIISLSPNSYLGEQSQSMVKQLDARAFVETKTIGAVLPMSGPYAQIGEQTLRGLQMALGISGSQNKYNIRLVVQDSLSTPEDAAKAIEKLIYVDHAIAIIGGLSAKTVMAEATRAQELGVPFLAMSQKSDLTKVGPFIFSTSITPRSQVEALVSYAMTKHNHKRFAIIYPNDRYGVEYANIFWDAVVSRGGKITAAQTYTPDETDFKAHIKKMVGTYYLEDRNQEYQELLREWKKKNTSKRKQPPETLLPPIVNFESLFIPDGPKALGQIAPMLSFNDVNEIQLLGTNLWNSPDFIPRAQAFVERSVLVDTHLPASPNYTNSDFYKNFRMTYKDRPGSFAIQGYDSGKLVLATLQNNPRNRIDFLRLLSTAENVAGAISPLKMSSDREVQRQLILMNVRKNEFVLAE